MANPRNATPVLPEASGSGIGNKASKAWAAVKPGVVLGLRATEKALDGLPVPGAKGCVGLILQFIETADIASDNVEALKRLQSRFESLQERLIPIYQTESVEIPENVRKDVEIFARELDKLATQWKHQLRAQGTQKRRRRDIIRGLISAKENRDSLSQFVSAVDRVIADFLAVNLANTRIELADLVSRVNRLHMQALKFLPRAASASYNSARTGGANMCLDGTRITIRQTIREWATNPDPKEPPMFWLNGLAGIGKTTIAHSIAAELDAAGLLGGSFVFLRADDQLKDARLVFPTLAFQTALHKPQFATHLVKAFELDPDCGAKRLDIQFEKLILQPFASAPLSSPLILILDALDECDPEILTKELLRIIHRNIQKVPFLRVFITSRPEGYIREALDLVDPTAPHRKLVLHEGIHAEEVEHDIRLYLKVNLQKLWNQRTKQTAVRWPSAEDLDMLVKQSGKLFVYAATAVRFLGGDPALDLERQLSVLLNVPLGHVPTGEPYQQLDGLYLQILKGAIAHRADNYYVERFRKIVGSIVLLERPLPLLSLAIFLDTDPDQKCSADIIRGTLYHLQSILIVPEFDNEPPRTYHLSFPNFITTTERCTDEQAYINPCRQAKYLFLRCVDTMKNYYGPPVIDDTASTSSSTRDTDATSNSPRSEEDAASIQSSVVDLDEQDAPSGRSSKSHVSLEDDLDDYGLSPEIRYSERYWCRHLTHVSVGDADVVTAFEGFIVHYWSVWITARTDRILNNVRDNRRLTSDTFDIIHKAYRWGVYSKCKLQCLFFLKRTAENAYATISPDTATRYEFGKRLPDPDVILPTTTPETDLLSDASSPSSIRLTQKRRERHNVMHLSTIPTTTWRDHYSYSPSTAAN